MHLLLLQAPSPGLLVTCIAPGHMWMFPEISFSTENYTVLGKKKPPPGVIPPYQLQVRENKTQTGVSKIKVECNGVCNQQRRHLEQATGLMEFRVSNGVIRSCPFPPFIFSTFLFFQADFPQRWRSGHRFPRIAFSRVSYSKEKRISLCP